MRFTVAFQVSEFDAGQAKRLAQFFRWLAYAGGDSFHCVLSLSFSNPAEAEQVASDIVARAGRAVPRWEIFRVKRRWSRWPQAPNEQWCQTIRFCAQRDLSPVLCIEPDDTPLDPHWLTKLHAEWESAGCPFILGAECRLPVWHINGNAILNVRSPWLSKVVEMVEKNISTGWDMTVSQAIASQEKPPRSAVPAKGIVSHWRATPTLDELAGLRAQGVVLFHGDKTGRALEFSRAILSQH